MKLPSRLHLAGACLILPLAFGASAAGAPAAVDAARIIAADREPGNWMSHGRTYDEQRHSPLKSINDRNVGELGLAWTARLDIDRGVEATPIVVDGVMYTTGAKSIVYAFDARSGTLLWKFDPEVPGIRLSEGCCDVVNRGVAVWQGKVYVGAYDGRLIALDARDGRKLWETDTVVDPARSYTITGAPRVVKGKVLIGNGGAEYGVRGYVSAYDADTGKLAWRFYTVPGDPAQEKDDRAMEIARKTWHGTEYWKQGGGGTVWDSMAYDPELDLLYIGTGNASWWNRQARSEGKGDNLFVSSIVALRPDSGEYVWHYQTTPGDMWDYTATQHIILAELPIDGKQRKVLMQAPKNGFFYVLDRTNGKLLSAEKFAPVNWATHVDLATGRPVVDEEAANYLKGPKVISPAFIGAHNWHPMSFNPATGLVYIPMQETAGMLSAPANPQRIAHKSVVNLGVDVPDLPEDPEVVKQIAASFKGKLLAWDPVRQQAAWTQDYRTIYNGGTLSTAGNLVFQGTADGRVTAYAADSGKLLWSSPANTGVMAGPVTYEVDGEQYVTFMAGWGGTFPLILGPLSLEAKVQPEARVLTYKLGGKAVLPPPAQLPQAVPQPPAVTASAEDIAAGRTLYNGFCGSCHGLNAISGGVLPDLRYLDARKHAQFKDIVLMGARAAKGMPPFAGTVSDADAERIHQYLIKRAHDLRQETARARP
ncbi:PQQ-dependent dehydrogenase, methanol/ethanol family [Parazoarcus communis]|uniref:PQQ-dependent dehydrogenase, methanol/ethanol family n=1 Tax=Parazoarcus communis SWub3 = DSM 12120 TaxID=1121029 RepID=A0A323USI2_9RHOO|nr:PQQ-dependent dehydrogenase, methanol/ethanol family [Parazoarcus communis]NMG72403.1 PQQ-dependent dehydrogenase, methanol/ethanol family [Parazoarcus communis SWub3 = DSM 12120]PZA14630.1 PQQ-dependent dehydrogenase, methanol/ethanol family [Azoarcus communis] [Parazoarcus communis SWub3 = DSM 12120]